jgi:hypothetical protein
MFAVVNQLHLSIPVDDLAPKVQAEGFPTLAQYTGFVAGHLVKVADDRCLILLLWESGQAAEAGARQFGPSWFKDNIAPHLASEQQRSAGPVVASSPTAGAPS